MKLECIESAFDEELDPVRIVYAADEMFVACTGVSIQSIICHASSNNKYDIVVLTRNVSSSRRKTLAQLGKGYENISVRVYPFDKLLDNTQIRVEYRPDMTITTFYRLALPWIFKEWDKVLYLDGDTFLMRDAADLYHESVEGYLIGACEDLCGQGAYLNPKHMERDYRVHTLQMKDPDHYFNAGVLIFNMKQFRENFTYEEIMSIASERSYRLHDQDVLNSICSGKTRFLDAKWNRMERMWFYEFLTKEYREKYAACERNPYLVHFSSDMKPWNTGYEDGLLEYWFQEFQNRKDENGNANLNVCTVINTGVGSNRIVKLGRSVLERMEDRFHQEAGIKELFHFVGIWYKVKRGSLTLEQIAGYKTLREPFEDGVHPKSVRYQAGLLEFWETAMDTPFLEELLAGTKNQVPLLTVHPMEVPNMDCVFLEKDAGMRTILHFAGIWLRYRIRNILKRDA